MVWQAIIRKAYVKLAIVIITLAVIGLSVIGHNGITWDEPMEIDMVKWNLAYIRNNEPISEHSRYHGFIFNYLANLIYEAHDNVTQKLFSSDKSKIQFANDKEQWLYNIKKKTRFKHIVTFIFSLLAYISVAGIVAILAGKQWAWFGAITLALFPIFWGHSFFNPKDIPFATLFTLATFLGACLLNLYFQSSPQETKLGFNRITLYSALYGSLVGLVTGVRIGGFFILFYLLIAHLLARLEVKHLFYTIRHFSKFYLLIFLSWVVTTFTVYPASWRNPITWFFEAVSSMSKFSVWDNNVLFDGQEIPGKSLPWYYLPKLVTITTPVIFQIAFLMGIIWIIFKYKQLSPTQRACIILVLLQVFYLPLIAILKQSTMYDGMRHFLFIIPGIAAIAATTLVWLYQKISSKYTKLFATTFILISFSVIIFDMISLHPYQYTYFNRAYGGIAKAHTQQETEYWGLSLKEGMEWLNKNAAPNSSLVLAGPRFAAEAFKDPSLNLKITHRDDFAWGKAPNPNYYLGISRYDYFKAFPDCPIVHSIARQNTPLAIIRKCP